MKRELDQKLVETFPIIYHDRYKSMYETCMIWGFSCNDGWYDLIYEASEKLEAIAQNQPLPKKHHPIKKAIWPLIDKISIKIRKMDPRHFVWPANQKRPEPPHIKAFIKKKILDKFWWHICIFFAPPEDNRLKATQVKEKFGSLRFYTNYTSDEIEKIIGEAERKSEITCEACGKTGSLRNYCNWYITLCDQHWDEYIKSH